MTPDVLARLLVNLADSREVARRSLSWLAEYQAARSVSLWRSNGDSASLELAAVHDEATLLGAKRALAEVQGELSLGAPILRESWALVPTGVEGCFAYVEDVGPDRLDAATTATIATFALKMLDSEERSLPDPGAWLRPVPAPRPAPSGKDPLFPVARKHAEA